MIKLQKTKTVKDRKEYVKNERMAKIKENLSKIRHKIVIISGKGGVGKTTVAVNLAFGLASKGLRVGLFDVDITGPNVAKMLGVNPELKPRVDKTATSFYPIDGPLNIKVLSMAFLTENSDVPVIWRGPLKMGVVRQFLGDAIWGDLDYLVCDLPPGTSDETLDILQLIPDENVIIVTTPQEVALMDARKTITMAQTMERNVLGIVENMSGFNCPHCGKYIELFPPGGAEKAAKDFGVKLLGKIPFEVEIGQQGDVGLPFIVKYPEAASAKSIKSIINIIQDLLENR